MGPPLKAAENPAQISQHALVQAASMGPPLKAAENFRALGRVPRAVLELQWGRR